MNKFISYIKTKFAFFILNRKLKGKKNSEIYFSTVFLKSFSFLIILPDNDEDFRASTQILRFLDDHKKSFQILTRDYRVSLLPQIYKNKVIEVGVSHLNYFDLPNRNLSHKLESMKFDVVIDLNRIENVFSLCVSHTVQSKVRIGFARKGSDKYFNFQVSNKEKNPEKSYNNFLNCLKMF